MCTGHNLELNFSLDFVPHVKFRLEIFKLLYLISVLNLTNGLSLALA